MATIKRHGTGWQARIRRRGYPQQTKTFRHKAHAESWARATAERERKTSHKQSC